MCLGEGKAPVYKHGIVHPFCPDCGRDLSVQGKHQKVVAGKIKRHKP